MSIGLDNGFSFIRRQAIVWTNAWFLSIGPLGTKFSEILIKIWNAYENVVCEMVAIFCPEGYQLNVFAYQELVTEDKESTRWKTILVYTYLHTENCL